LKHVQKIVEFIVKLCSEYFWKTRFSHEFLIPDCINITLQYTNYIVIKLLKHTHTHTFKSV